MLNNRVMNTQSETVSASSKVLYNQKNFEKKNLPVFLKVSLHQFESRQAVFMLNSALRIIYLNKNANTLVAKSDGLTRKKKQFVLEDRSAHLMLESMVQLQTEQLNQPVSSNSFVAMRPSKNLPLYIRVSPLKSLNGHSSDCSYVIVQIEEPEYSIQSPDDYLMQHYSLTQREVDVASKIFDGLNAKNIAQTLNLTHGTVRQYIKAILKKTGNKNQLALVRLMYFLSRPQIRTQEVTLTQLEYANSKSI